jgi:hypothetical protein|tara:strand:- start:101 stop:205 length:105 start_codon:yes stop_codon:yes gene_type:complete
MPYGTGTYGSKVGRPPKKKNKAKQMLGKKKPKKN